MTQSHDRSRDPVAGARMARITYLTAIDFGPGALARRLQDEGAKSFLDSWKDLLGAIETKSKALT